MSKTVVTISLCMIVKDEQDTLERCLSSVQDIVNEIIIVDTGSKDNTKQIACKYTQHIYDFEWIDDFAAARNFSFEQATQDYILWMDADDVLEEEDRQKFIVFKQQLDLDIDRVMMPYHLALDVDGKPTCTLRRNRLVRRDRGFRWEGAVHEALIVSGTVIQSDIAITHRKEKSQPIAIYSFSVSESKQTQNSARGTCTILPTSLEIMASTKKRLLPISNFLRRSKDG